MKKLIAIVLMGLSTAVYADCVRKKPSVLINPGYQFLKQGQAGVVQVGLRNNDSLDCGETVYYFSAENEGGLFALFPDGKVESKPSSLVWTHLVVFASPKTSLGQYLVFTYANPVEGGGMASFSSASVEVKSPMATILEESKN